MTTVVQWIAARGPLRDGLDVATAADLVWTVTSPEVHHMLLETRGWSRGQYEVWLRDTLEHALLGEAGGPLA
jgi:hypothetical protein